MTADVMTAGILLRQATMTLHQAGIDTSRLDARLLLSHITGLDPGYLFTHPDLPISPDHQQSFQQAVLRRAERRPLSHITGQRGFWTLTLTVTPDTLDPRPDTETLVQLVLDRLPDRNAPLRLVDFGTGTGAIVLALLSELPHAQGVAVDISPAALAVATANAAANGLADRMTCRLADWGQDMDEGGFHVAVSNPPYIPAADMAGLSPEIRDFEPRLALVGPDADGAGCYRTLIPDMARLLVPGGLAAVEVGYGQADCVSLLFQQAGFQRVASVADLGGIDRCVYGFLPES